MNDSDRQLVAAIKIKFREWIVDHYGFYSPHMALLWAIALEELATEIRRSLGSGEDGKDGDR